MPRRPAELPSRSALLSLLTPSPNCQRRSRSVPLLLSRAAIPCLATAFTTRWDDQHTRPPGHAKIALGASAFPHPVAVDPPLPAMQVRTNCRFSSPSPSDRSLSERNRPHGPLRKCTWSPRPCCTASSRLGRLAVNYHERCPPCHQFGMAAGSKPLRCPRLSRDAAGDLAPGWPSPDNPTSCVQVLSAGLDFGPWDKPSSRRRRTHRFQDPPLLLPLLPESSSSPWT